jgi:hypothetical protein
MKAVIELVCHAHPTADGPGPLVTVVEQMWAYCEGNAQDGHDWTRIEPTRREHVPDFSQMLERRAS